MDEDAFQVDPEQQEVREIADLEQVSEVPLLNSGQDQKNIALKMIDVPKPEMPVSYQSFKINTRKEQEEQEQEECNHFQSESPFTQSYSSQQMIYRRFDNQSLNRLKKSRYFSGTFIANNILLNCNKSQAINIVDLLQQDYEIDHSQIQVETDQLHFDSEFESGNLFAVFKVAKREFDLVMQNDINSCGNTQWFYFAVWKMQIGVQYTFNVVNFTKSDSLFNYGMSPVAYSTVANRTNGSEWFRVGRDIEYKKGKMHKENSWRYYYRLSFKFSWRHSNDKAYFAFTYPYTYSKLLNRIKSLLNQQEQIVTRFCAGKTVSKRSIEGLIITQKSRMRKDNRKAIIVMARQHPGETQGSYVCDGVINKLLERCPEADFIRRNYVVYVIPMVNPDGVIFGHYRTNLLGKDLNRKWDSTEKQLTCPQVTAIKSFLAQLNKTREIRFVLDLHGHSKKLNSFFYGNPYPDHPEHVRIFPYLCSKMNGAIQFMDCTFAIQQYKRRAARVCLSSMLKQIQVYTFQSSFYGYFRHGKKQQFTIKQYQNLGCTLIESLSALLQNDYKQCKKDSMYMKYLTQLKNNTSLLTMGNQNESGSDSRPQQGQLNENEVSEMSLHSRKSITVSSNAELVRKSDRKIGSRKNNRPPPQIREVNRPTRNLKFLSISQVNSVLPDKNQFGLQPINRKQPSEMSRTQSSMLKMNSYCQTDAHELIGQLQTEEIIESLNLSNSVKSQVRKCSSKRFNSVIKSSNRNNNIIFRIDFASGGSNSTSMSIKTRSTLYNAFSQTVITFKRTITDCNKSSELFPLMQSPKTDRKHNSNRIKYNPIKIPAKKQAQVFLNGMVKQYLVEKDLKHRDQHGRCLQRPLSIKKKDIYKK